MVTQFFSTGGNAWFLYIETSVYMNFLPQGGIVQQKKKKKKTTINIYIYIQIFKTIEATEQSLMEFINTKNSDVSDLFKDLNLPQNTSKNTRKEIEDYYVEVYQSILDISYFIFLLKQKFKQYTLSSNLITRLQARHDIMQKALGAASTNSLEDKKYEEFIFRDREKRNLI